MQSVLELAPPARFRKAIPVSVKLEVVIRQHSLCSKCGQRLGKLDDTQFDHVPAIQLRCWDAEAKDTTPRSNDPAFIEAKHTDCHAKKTFGSREELTRGDVQEIARTKRVAKDTEEFRRRMLAKGDPEVEAPQPRRKKAWPKRPFPKRGKNGKTRTRGEEGSGGDET
ncbi:hypothetical protein FXV83_15895 [Bradyrhizobium hipponense]|uniref:Uncharacterized protein n=1 Tax=Bradyrhizobium hipponense TaxID=2605638 RepID=A0A5S4YPR0_9BRAD|nr:hypothetical protein [Bradyrhizobium hipponense]TYO65417.1 hypothetical protein FXV83_15895 [Bradyrhizobium hipponense]